MTLTVNANDIEGATSVKVRYRILGSGGTYMMLNLTPDQFPYSITGVANAQYEVGLSILCSNDVYSDWVNSVSTPCASIVSLAVSESGGTFTVAATLATGQRKIQVQMTDPNGAITTYNHDFGGISGTFTIPVTSGVFGNYTFVARGMCNDGIIPVYASSYTSPQIVNVPGGVLTLVANIRSIDRTIGQCWYEFILSEAISTDTLAILNSIDYVLGSSPPVHVVVGAVNNINTGNTSTYPTADLSFVFNPSGDPLTSVTFTFSVTPNPASGVTIAPDSPRTFVV